MVEDCSRPVQLPSRILSQSEVEAFWIGDRANLVTCGEKHKALKEFYRLRDSEITGAKID